MKKKGTKRNEKQNETNKFLTIPQNKIICSNKLKAKQIHLLAVTCNKCRLDHKSQDLMIFVEIIAKIYFLVNLWVPIIVDS